MIAANNWHLKLLNDERHDLNRLLDFVMEMRDSKERFPLVSIFAQDVLDSLVTITPDDPK
jgi:hypothetical protein